MPHSTRPRQILESGFDAGLDLSKADNQTTLFVSARQDDPLFAPCVKLVEIRQDMAEVNNGPSSLVYGVEDKVPEELYDVSIARL